MIESPCKRACMIDKTTWTCVSCFRTADEIAHWPTMNDAERIDTLKRCQQRAMIVKFSSGGSHVVGDKSH